MSGARVAQKGPYMKDVEAGKDYWWCACGQSKNQPFCDGSHKGSAFSPVAVEGGRVEGGLFLRLQANRGQALLRRHAQQAVSIRRRSAALRRRQRLVPLARGVALAAAACLLADCSAPTLPCPTAKILREAATVTRLAPGQPSTPQSVQFVGSINEAKLSCSYDPTTYEKLTVVLGVQIAAQRPQAAGVAAADLRYFVAIVNLEGEVLGKREFPVAARLSRGGHDGQQGRGDPRVHPAQISPERRQPPDLDRLPAQRRGAPVQPPAFRRLSLGERRRGAIGRSAVPPPSDEDHQKKRSAADATRSAAMARASHASARSCGPWAICASMCRTPSGSFVRRRHRPALP